MEIVRGKGLKSIWAVPPSFSVPSMVIDLSWGFWVKPTMVCFSPLAEKRRPSAINSTGDMIKLINKFNNYIRLALICRLRCLRTWGLIFEFLIKSFAARVPGRGEYRKV